MYVLLTDCTTPITYHEYLLGSCSGSGGLLGIVLRLLQLYSCSVCRVYVLVLLLLVVGLEEWTVSVLATCRGKRDGLVKGQLVGVYA